MPLPPFTNYKPQSPPPRCRPYASARFRPAPMHGRPSPVLPSLPRPVPPAARRGDRPRDTPRRSPPPRPAALRPARGAAAPRQSCSGPRRGRAEYAAGPRAGRRFVPGMQHIGQPFQRVASSQGLVMASRRSGRQTMLGLKPSARRYAAPAAPICNKNFAAVMRKKVRMRRQCVRAVAQYFCIFQIPHRRVKGIQPGAPRGKGGLSLVGQPAGAAVQTDHERVAR